MAVEVEKSPDSSLSKAVAHIQKRVFLDLEKYRSTSGDEIWSSEWKQLIHGWLISHSTGKTPLQGIEEIVKRCKNKVAKSRKMPNQLQFADLFLAHPSEAFVLWYLIGSLYQFDTTIMKKTPHPALPDAMETLRPLEYLQNSYSGDGLVDSATFERFYPRLCFQALVFNNAAHDLEDYVKTASHEQGHDFFWIITDMKLEVQRRNETLHKLEEIQLNGFRKMGVSENKRKSTKRGLAKRRRQSQSRFSLSPY